MDFGIISLGNHAMTKVMPAIIASGSRITHIYSTDRTKGERVSKDIGAEYLPDLESFVKGSFEAVYISSPNFLHFTHAKMCLEAGKSVLLEKPVTLKIEDTETLVNFSEKENLNFRVGFHLRFHPAVEEVKKSLALKQIGEPKIAFGKWTRNSAPYDSSIWRGQPDRSGGGSVVGLGVHIFDSFVNLFGRDIKSISAFSLPRCSVLDDTMQVSMEFENGVIANSLSSRVIPSDSNDLKIFGEEGILTVTNFYSTTISSSLYINDKLTKEYDNRTDMYLDEIKDFIGSRRLIAGPQDALLSTKIHLKSQESACSGRVWRLNDT